MGRDILRLWNALRNIESLSSDNDTKLGWGRECLDSSWCASVNNFGCCTLGTASVFYLYPATSVTVICLANNINALRGCVDVHLVHGSCTISVRYVVVVEVDRHRSVCWGLGDCACESGFGDLFRVLSGFGCLAPSVLKGES
jgi:hypothetical protein